MGLWYHVVTSRATACSSGPGTGCHALTIDRAGPSVEGGRSDGAETGLENMLRIVALNPWFAVIPCVLAWLVARLAAPAFRWIRWAAVGLPTQWDVAVEGGRGYPGGRTQARGISRVDCGEIAGAAARRWSCGGQLGSEEPAFDTLQRTQRLFAVPSGTVAGRTPSWFATTEVNDSMRVRITRKVRRVGFSGREWLDALPVPVSTR